MNRDARATIAEARRLLGRLVATHRWHHLSNSSAAARRAVFDARALLGWAETSVAYGRLSDAEAARLAGAALERLEHVWDYVSLSVTAPPREGPSLGGEPER